MGTYLDRDGFDRVDPGLLLQACRGTYLDRDGFDRVDPGLLLQAGRSSELAVIVGSAQHLTGFTHQVHV